MRHIIKLLQHYIQVWQWRSNLNIKSHLRQIAMLYHDVDGFTLSRQAREDKPDLSLSYGEIHLESFLALMSFSQVEQHTYFYDLGCGLGKTVHALAHVYPQLYCCGVEIIQDLFEIAVLKNSASSTAIQNRTRFIHGNLLDVMWPETAIIFINTASFIQESWQALEEKCQITPAQTFITCCKPLNLNNYHVEKTRVTCSWAIVPAYIHHKI